MNLTIVPRIKVPLDIILYLSILLHILEFRNRHNHTVYSSTALQSEMVTPYSIHTTQGPVQHYGPGVDSASNGNEYQESSQGLRAAGVWD
jgi:hypothetical protein